MRRPLTLLLALALCLLACGHYGPPKRPDPQPTTASDAAETDESEETEKSE